MKATAPTTADRAVALTRFGYTPLEATFLAQAALQSGYFLRRQYARFLGRRDGGLVAQFVARVIDLGHARTSTWRRGTQIYDLYSRQLFEALGDPDNRNRRNHEWAVIKNRIMCLDFLLGRPDDRFLMTQPEKVHYFTNTSKVPQEVLPYKTYRARSSRAFATRFFVEKFPIFTEPAAPSTPVFCFVDEGMAGLSRFETFMNRYASLFAALRASRLIFVAENDRHFAAASAAFARILTNDETTGSDAGDEKQEGLLEYFRLRRRYETRAFNAFDRTQLLALRDARERFAAPEIEAKYSAWLDKGDAVLSPVSDATPSVFAPRRVSFSTEILNEDYSMFHMVLPR